MLFNEIKNKCVLQVLFVFIVAFPVFSQEKVEDDRPYFIVECDARNKKGEPEKGVELMVYSSDSIIAQSVSDSLGKFDELLFFYNSELIIKFKKHKFVRESVVINSNIEV